MKKRVILGTILPVFAAVAVIGSGYAIWHFNDTASTKNTSMGFDITNVIQGANLDADFDALKLTFDQTTRSRETVNSSEASVFDKTSLDSNGTTTATGITLSATKSNSNVEDPKVSYKNIATNEIVDSSYATPEGKNPTIGQVFTVTLSMPTTVANYITITLNTADWTETTTKNSSTSDTTTWVWTNTTYGEATWKWSYVSFAYNTTEPLKEPTNISEYAALSSALNSATDGAKAVYEAYRWAK